MKIYRSITNPEAFRLGENGFYRQIENCESEFTKEILRKAMAVLEPGEAGDVQYIITIQKLTKNAKKEEKDV